MARTVPPEERDWEAEIRGRQEEWMDALRRHHLEALEHILAEEYTLVSARFGFVDRRRYLDIAREYQLHEFGYDESHVFLHGDWAIVHSRYHEQADWRDRDVSHHFYLTDVWIFRDDRWQAVTRHSSIPVPREDEPG